MFHNQRGQINLLGIIGVGVTIAIATIGGFMAQNYRNDTKFDVVKTDIGLTNQRTSRLEADTATIKDDLKEIKSDIKLLLKKLK